MRTYWSENTTSYIKQIFRKDLKKVSRNTAIFTICILSITILAVLVRIQPMKWGFYLSEFDPYFHYSITENIVENGISSWGSHTNRVWYPYGRDIAQTAFPGLPISAALFYYFLTGIGLQVSVLDACIIFPVMMAAITCIVAYFLGKEIGGRAVGLFTSLFLALNPAYIGRTVLGFFDTETVGIFATLLFFLFYLRSLDPDKSLKVSTGHALVAGISLGYLFVSWGASRYPLTLIALFTLILLTLRRYSTRLLTSYSVIIAIGLLIAVNVPRLGFSFITEIETVAVLGVFLLMCMFKIFSYLTTKKGKILFVTCFLLTISAAIVILGFYDIISFPVEKFISVINPFQRIKNPLIESVQEHRPTTWSAFYYQFGSLVFFAPIGFFLVSRKSTEKNIFLILYALSSLYFAASLIRLTILLAPAFCLLGALAVVELLKYITKKAKEKKGRRMKHSLRFGKGFSLTFVILLFGVVIYPLMRGIDYAYSPTTIASSSIPIRDNIDDWQESLSWMKDNIPRDDVVVSWWDYGYWITVMGDKITLTDNGTLNMTQIAQVGRIFMSNETQALNILKKYDAKYVVVFTTLAHSLNPEAGPILYGDEVKWRWMALIGGYNDTQLEDYSITYQLAYNLGGGNVQELPWLTNFALPKSDTVLTKLIVYGAIPEYDPWLQVKPTHFDLVFSSSSRMVFIYKIMY